MALRTVLLLDAAGLVALGGSIILVPTQVAAVFGFGPLTPAVVHLTALWACALITLGVATFAAALNPWRHVIIIRMGIARGALEFVLGAAHVALGVVTLAQAATGMVTGLAVAITYTVFYPRRPTVAIAAEPAAEEPDHAA